jgi:hypothetical protein
VRDEITSRFGAAEALDLRRQVARALPSKGHVLDELGRSDDSSAAFDEVVSGVGDAVRSGAARIRDAPSLERVCSANMCGTLCERLDQLAPTPSPAASDPTGAGTSTPTGTGAAAR